jgi:hypothetical protein
MHMYCSTSGSLITPFFALKFLHLSSSIPSKYSFSISFLKPMKAINLKRLFLQAHPEAGLALFKNLDPPIPPQTVLSHLRAHAPQLSAAYLEHILGGSAGSQPPSLPVTPQKPSPGRSLSTSSSFGGDSFGGETTPPAAKTPSEEEGLSNKLVLLYLERVLEEAKEGGVQEQGQAGGGEGGKESRGGGWDERAKSETREKLLSLLERSTAYDPKRLLSEIPNGILLYERALLLGRLGRHRQALAIYARGLGDVSAAEEYCSRFHEGGGDDPGGINQSIGMDTGAVVGGRGMQFEGGRESNGKVRPTGKKAEREGTNMFLTLLEVSVNGDPLSAQGLTYSIEGTG